MSYQHYPHHTYLYEFTKSCNKITVIYYRSFQTASDAKDFAKRRTTDTQFISYGELSIDEFQRQFPNKDLNNQIMFPIKPLIERFF